MWYMDDHRFIYGKQWKKERLTVVGAWERRWEQFDERSDLKGTEHLFKLNSVDKKRAEFS